MAARKRFLPWVSAFLLLIFCIAYLSREWWLTAAGQALVASEPPAKADAVLVLAGDHRGRRILKACELVRDGFAPVAYVSGPMEWYGVNEAELGIRFAVARGCSESWFQPLVVRALSTVEEAGAIVPILKSRGVHNLIVVTSNYHSSRSRAVYLEHVPAGMSVRLVAAPDPYFTPDGWWRTREGQKTVFFEISKTIAWRVGL